MTVTPDQFGEWTMFVPQKQIAIKRALEHMSDEIVKLSGGISFDKVGRKSTGPKYWDGSKMVPKTGCGEK